MIPQIKKILYVTDLSKNSTYAYRYAVNMAERYNAEIVILHAIEPIPPMVKHYVKLLGHRPGLPGHAVARGMRAKEVSF
jgi:nucleotide-binding universal stress UspA family protein